MAIEVTQVFTRPSADVPWFIDTLPESHLQYIRENYVATGKLTGTTTRPDELTLTQTFSFTTPENQEEFLTDPYMAEKALQRTVYNTQNDIVIVDESFNINA
jgi:hypothetical protein